MAHEFWIEAGARNIREATASTSRCRFMRALRAPIDNIDLVACVVIVALIVIYQVTP